MTTYTINETNEIVAFASPEEAAANSATPFDTFSNADELAQLVRIDARRGNQGRWQGRQADLQANGEARR
jgi:hypothetical protein